MGQVARRRASTVEEVHLVGREVVAAEREVGAEQRGEVQVRADDVLEALAEQRRIPELG